MTEKKETPDRPKLTEEQIQDYRELANLGGIHLSQEALAVILQLLSTGAAPNSLNTVLNAFCKRPGTGAAARRQTVISTALKAQK